MKRQILIGFFLVLFLSSCQDSVGLGRAAPVQTQGERLETFSRVRHVAVIVLENTDLEDTVNQSFFRKLIQRGALLANYYAITHPSQPNYIAMISGQQHDVYDDENITIPSDPSQKAQHLGDLLELSGKTWKAYAEGYPGSCYLGRRHNAFARKHVPFLSFQNVTEDPIRCSQVVNGSVFQADLKAGQLPTFSLYVPDMNNDGHDTGIGFADGWLGGFFGPILDNAQAMAETLWIVTFDEGSHFRNNRVATVMLGAGVWPGAVSRKKYSHYSILRTIEEILSLPSLDQNDKTALLIDDIWH